MDSVVDHELSLSRLAAADPALAAALSRVLGVVAAEAARTPRFAAALKQALTLDEARPAAPAPRTSTPRAKGLFDPFPVFEVSGEAGLRARLRTLSPDQLKDIIAEHGMNYDKAAMRWKTAARLTDRIVERVQTRAAKGTVLR
ncbi:hypothetical protein [Nocardia sp. NPDC052566]|uniref:hypothetical protein n=1 Tax=Nocardia sp. NPDC052566 TaxID=3364330 RepID=UPI0037CAC6AF